MVLRRIYITHCTARKDKSVKESGIAVTPDKLYTGKRIVAFITRCKEMGVKWAILSDKYGVVYPHEKINYYELDPNKLEPIERRVLSRFLTNSMAWHFSKKGESERARVWLFERIWFYHHPQRFHKVYRDAIDFFHRQVKIGSFKWKIDDKTITFHTPTTRVPKIVLFSTIEDIRREPPLYKNVPPY